MKEANIMRKSNVIRQVKDSVSKTLVCCPNILKLYSNGKGGVYIQIKKQPLTDSIVKKIVALN